MTGAQAQQPSLVGNWTWTDANGCAELYSYAQNGSYTVTSGDEESRGEWTISPRPDSNGFLLVTGKTLEGNRQADCAGRVADDTEQEFTFYVTFHPTAPVHLVCQQPSLSRCIGPLVRTGQVAPGPGRTSWQVR